MKSKRKSRKAKSRRNVTVAAILMGSLTFTSMLLVVLAPAPLLPDPASAPLLAEDTNSISNWVTSAFDTRQPVEASRWQYIYIHHSRTPRGDLQSIGETIGWMDHFVIGNGLGCPDGAIQVGHAWRQQQPAVPPAGTQIDPRCITICLVGDFDQSAPTARQVRHLGQLVSELQRRLNIPARNVMAYDRSGTPAGIGRHFPMASLAGALEP